MLKSPSHRLGVILLAAGASSRMGRPKLLLPWGNTSVLGHIWKLLSGLNPGQSILVLAPDHGFAAELDRLKIPPSSLVHNPEPSLGMFSSVRTGLSWPGWKPETTHFLIALGDQPLVSEHDLKALLAASIKTPEAIFQPLYQGKRGHPIVLPKNIALALLDKVHFSLKEALAEYQAMLRFVESDGPGTLQDIDTPDDYLNLSPGNSAKPHA